MCCYMRYQARKATFQYQVALHTDLFRGGSELKMLVDVKLAKIISNPVWVVFVVPCRHSLGFGSLHIVLLTQPLLCVRVPRK